jgi:hypothetical protein
MMAIEELWRLADRSRHRQSGVHLMKFMLMLAALALPTAAHAGWVEESWSDELTSRIGSPAITIHGDGTVAVVVQGELLSQYGLAATVAAQTLLEHYGPRQCSDLLDLNVAHDGLQLEVYVARIDGVRSVVDAEPTTLTIDYAPSRTVRCVDPDADLIS